MTKGYFLLLLLFVQFCFAGAQTAVYPNNGTLFDGKLHRLELLMDVDSLAALLHIDNRWTNHSYPATLVYDKQDTVKNIGVRIKGNTSRNANKLSFKIDMDAFQNKTYQGLKTLNLNGNHNDPSMCREYLSAYVMSKAGNKSLRANLVKLYFNGVYYGLYTNSEVVNKTFVESRFGNKTGNLYKCSWPADLAWIDNNQNSYKKLINPSPLNERAYELKTNEALDNYSDLVTLINTINNTPKANFKAAIDTIFNVQAYLKVLATEVLIGHWDSYFLNKSNYYLYFNSQTKKFEYLPYDLDNTYGVQWGVANINNRDIHNWGNKANSKAPLTYKLFEVAEFKKDYENYLRQMVDSVFNEKKLFPVIDSLKVLIKDAIQTDPYYSGIWPSDYDYTFNIWFSSFDSKVDDHATFGVKPYISDRLNSAKNQYLYGNQIGIREANSVFRIFPNPVNDVLNIRLDVPNAYFELMSVEGKSICEKELLKGEIIIETGYLKSGLYFVKLTYSNKITILKVLKT